LGLGLALLREGGIGSGGVVDGSVVTHGGRAVIVNWIDGKGVDWGRERGRVEKGGFKRDGLQGVALQPKQPATVRDASIL
jgi:hypothetical protein